jgi:hypothetical protein
MKSASTAADVRVWAAVWVSPPNSPLPMRVDAHERFYRGRLTSSGRARCSFVEWDQLVPNLDRPREVHKAVDPCIVALAKIHRRALRQRSERLIQAEGLLTH